MAFGMCFCLRDAVVYKLVAVKDNKNIPGGGNCVQMM